MDIDVNNAPNETNESLYGVTKTGFGITILLHGVTDLNVLDHSYSRQSNDCSVNNPDNYTTTEDEDDAIEGLLQLSAADSPLVDFPGNNSQLMPIGVNTPNTAPMDIKLEMAVVTAAIEIIALEETVAKTTSTVSTQTTFTRPKHRQPVEISNSDSDNNLPKKPTTRSQTKENEKSTKKAEFKTVKYGIKKQLSSSTYACKECGKCKRDLKELNKHYKCRHKPVMCHAIY